MLPSPQKITTHNIRLKMKKNKNDIKNDTENNKRSDKRNDRKSDGTSDKRNDRRKEVWSGVLQWLSAVCRQADGGSKEGKSCEKAYHVTCFRNSHNKSQVTCHATPRDNKLQQPKPQTRKVRSTQKRHSFSFFPNNNNNKNKNNNNKNNYYDFRFGSRALQVTEGERAFLDASHVNVPRIVHLDQTLKSCLFFRLSEAPFHGRLLFLFFHHVANDSNDNDMDTKNNNNNNKNNNNNDNNNDNNNNNKNNSNKNINNNSNKNINNNSNKNINNSAQTHHHRKWPSEASRVEVDTFSLQHLIHRRVYYEHDGSESLSDSLQLVADLNLTMVKSAIYRGAKRGKKEEYEEELERLYQIWPPSLRPQTITLQVDIKSSNDPPVMRMRTSVTMVADTELLMTSDILSASDVDDDDATLVWIVHYGGSAGGPYEGSDSRVLTDVGYFEVEDAFGHVRSRVKRFRQQELKEGKVTFVHRGIMTQTVALQLSDGKQTTAASTLTFIGSPLSINEVVNTGVVVERWGGFCLITPSNLSFASNHASLHDDDIRFHMVDPPYEGLIQRRRQSGEYVADEEEDNEDGAVFEEEDIRTLSSSVKNQRSNETERKNGRNNERKNKRKNKNRKKKKKGKKGKQGGVEGGLGRKGVKEGGLGEGGLGEGVNTAEGVREDEWEVVRSFSQQQINELRIRYLHYPDFEEEEEEDNNGAFKADMATLEAGRYRGDGFKFKVSVLNRETSEYDFKVAIKTRSSPAPFPFKPTKAPLTGSMSHEPHPISTVAPAYMTTKQPISVEDLVVDEYGSVFIEEEDIRLNCEGGGGRGEGGTSGEVEKSGDSEESERRGMMLVLMSTPKYGQLFVVDRSTQQSVNTNHMEHTDTSSGAMELHHTSALLQSSDTHTTVDLQRHRLLYKHTKEGSSQDSIGFKVLLKRPGTCGGGMGGAGWVPAEGGGLLYHAQDGQGLKLLLHILPEVLPLQLKPLSVRRQGWLLLHEEAVDVGGKHFFNTPLHILVAKQPLHGNICIATNASEFPVVNQFSHEDVRQGRVAYRHGGEGDADWLVLQTLHRGRRSKPQILHVHVTPLKHPNNQTHVNSHVTSTRRPAVKKTMLIPTSFTFEVVAGSELQLEVVQGGWNLVHDWQLWRNSGDDVMIVVEEQTSIGKLVRLGMSEGGEEGCGREMTYASLLEASACWQGVKKELKRLPVVEDFTSEEVAAKRILFLHDGHNANPGSISYTGYRTNSFKTSSFSGFIHIHVTPLRLTASTNGRLDLLQGDFATPVHHHLLNISTNTADPNFDILFTFLSTASGGVLSCGEKLECSSFNLLQLLQGHVWFVQVEERLEDYVSFSISDGSNVIEPVTLPLLVTPRLPQHQQKLQIVTSTSWFRVTLFHLNASLLAQLSQDDPLFRVVGGMEQGTLLVNQRRMLQAGGKRGSWNHTLSEEALQEDAPKRRRGAAQSGQVVTFRHSHVVEGTLVYLLQTPLEAGGVVREVVRLLIHAKNCQTAETALSFEITKDGGRKEGVKEGGGDAENVDENGENKEDAGSEASMEEWDEDEDDDDGDFELDSTQRQYLLIAVILGVLTVFLLLVCCCIAVCCCLKQRKRKNSHKASGLFDGKANDVITSADDVDSMSFQLHESSNRYSGSGSCRHSGGKRLLFEGAMPQAATAAADERGDYLVPNPSHHLKPPPQPLPHSFPSHDLMVAHSRHQSGEHLYDEPPGSLAVSADELNQQAQPHHSLHTITTSHFLPPFMQPSQQPNCLSNFTNASSSSSSSFPYQHDNQHPAQITQQQYSQQPYSQQPQHLQQHFQQQKTSLQPQQQQPHHIQHLKQQQQQQQHHILQQKQNLQKQQQQPQHLQQQQPQHLQQQHPRQPYCTNLKLHASPSNSFPMKAFSDADHSPHIFVEANEATNKNNNNNNATDNNNNKSNKNSTNNNNNNNSTNKNNNGNNSNNNINSSNNSNNNIISNNNSNNNSNNSNTISNNNSDSYRGSSVMSETSEWTNEGNSNWKELEPELLEHCRITNPVLKKMQYWV